MSARAEFIGALRAGLRELPADVVDDVIADYQSHFNEGAAVHRTDQEISTALGDPSLLANDLRLQLCVEKWESAPSPRSAWKVIVGVAAAGIINTTLLTIVAPFLLLVTMIAIISVIALFSAGLWLLFAGASLDLPGGTSVIALGATGLLTGGVSLTALLTLAIRMLVTALGARVRAHSRLLTRTSRAGANS